MRWRLAMSMLPLMALEAHHWTCDPFDEAMVLL